MELSCLLLHFIASDMEICEVKELTFKEWLIHLNAGLNPICHLLALLRAHHILHVSAVRVKYIRGRFHAVGFFFNIVVLDVAKNVLHRV